MNAAFLAPWPTIKKACDKVGLVDWLVGLLTESGLLEKMKTAISLDLQKLSVGLQNVGIGSPSGTDGGISESPSTLPAGSSKKKEKQLH